MLYVVCVFLVLIIEYTQIPQHPIPSSFQSVLPLPLPPHDGPRAVAAAWIGGGALNPVGPCPLEEAAVLLRSPVPPDRSEL